MLSPERRDAAVPVRSFDAAPDSDAAPQRIRWLVAGALLLCAVSAAVPAQADVESASLRGTVQDAQGPRAGAVVAAENLDTGQVRQDTASANGGYQIVGLKPGPYVVRVDAQQAGNVTLRIGERATMDLEVGTAAGVGEQPEPDVAAPEVEAPESAAQSPVEEIVVTAVQVDAFQGGEVGTVVTPEQIERLPQLNRNFLSFADLAPGVQFVQRRDGTATIRGGAQHQRGVNVFLDGVSQKDYVLKGGITGQDTSRGNPFPQSAIAEYRVITQNYKAEYEHVSSAAITAVTASGTNEFKSSVFADYTNERWRSATPLEEEEGEKADSTQTQYGVNLSGPIIRDRLHFLVAFEAKDNEDPVDVVPGVGYTRATLPPEYRDQVGREVTDFEEDLYFGKIDWIISDNHELTASVKYRDESAIQGVGNADAFSTATSADVEDTRFQAKHTWRGEGWQNEFRVTYEDSVWSPNPLTSGIGEILEDASGERILYTGAGANFQRKGQEGWGFFNEFSLLDVQWLGRHNIKAGIKYKNVTLKTLQQLPANPQYHYNVEINGAGGFDVEQPYRVEIGVPLTPDQGSLETTSKQYGVFIQDDWDVNDRLTLNLGVRWDYEETPSYKNRVTPAPIVETLRNWENINNPNAGYDIDDWISTGDNRDYDSDNIAPRVGFSLALDPAGTHTLYGGYGRSYDRNQFDYLQLEVTQGTFGTVAYQFEGDPDNPCSGDNCIPWDPVYLTQEGRDALTDAAELDGGNREISLLNNDLETPYSDQYSIGLRSAWGTWNTDLTYSHVESRNGFNWLLGNRLPDGSFFPPGAIWGAPFGFTPPGYSNLLLSSNDLETETDSVYLKVERFHEDTWGVSFAYTYTDGEANRTYDGHYTLDYPTIEGYGIRESIGVPDHRLVVTGTYDLPWNLLLSGKYTIDSGTAYQYNDCLAGADQCVLRRVEPDESAYSRLDLSLSKVFMIGMLSDGELELRLDVINVFNTHNWTDFDLFPGDSPSSLNGNFAEPTGPVGIPRTAKLAVRFNW